MLASETEEISDFLKSIIVERYGEKNYKTHFADTRDTLVLRYQRKSKKQLTASRKRSRFSHCGWWLQQFQHLTFSRALRREIPTYFIKTEEEILSKELIQHYHYETKEMLQTHNFLPEKDKLKIILTSGASCPDAIVDKCFRNYSLILKEHAPLKAF